MIQPSKFSLASNSVVVFQGDSITDAGRGRNHNESLGDGYVMMAASWISALYPEYRIKFYNRGIGGNHVRDLKNRWKKDCLDLKPNMVSILVGINDIYWKSTKADSFEADYTSILDQTRQINARIILLEPFLVFPNRNIDGLAIELDEKLVIVRKLAQQFGATLVPLNDIFMNACSKRESSFWSLDGVHPTLAGHALIAQSWIKNVLG